MKKEKGNLDFIKIVDFTISILISVGAMFLLKHILGSIGAQFEIPFLIDLTWKGFFGIFAVAALLIANLSVRVEAKQDKEKNSELPLTTKTIAHVLNLLITWGIFSIIAQIF